MAKSFSLAMYPWVYCAKYEENGSWKETFQEKSPSSPEEESRLSEEARTALLAGRNSFPELPLVNYTSQYGLGCFEGLKAFPQKDGSLKLFRPDENARRFRRSMEGLLMPGFPEELFVGAVVETVRRNKERGYAPAYDPVWEKDDFVGGHSVYIRPFSYSEPAIGLGTSNFPWVVVITTPVGAYFEPGSSKAVTTDRIRATPRGTGWIKAAANYVIPILAKKEAEKEGYMEAVFLDALESRYIEEGSSSNIFFLLKDGTLVTPDLKDTILPGINRLTVITLARDMGIKTEERPVSIDEVMSEGIEAFVSGTAAGVSFLESLTHKGKTRVFGDGKPGELTVSLLKTIKGIQYGAIPDKYNWMVPVPD